ncbi:MAG: uroporphyrinogen decarboxylase family protein [Candidatus Omnitrophica bacterium]|nr:uroporphyrinogen decarboxylase family protein [Candidatus Omnitrophota bacterium]MCM8802488.1 uroporphyrinogen decarboxylase family protein [Candidatus Omnitrophota bacterium]
MGQNFNFSFSEHLLLEIGNINFYQLHFDAESILKAYEKLKEIAEELQVPSPIPRMAGFAYPHIASLGAKIEFPLDGEPKPFPIIKNPEDIDNLKEPEDYLSTPIIQKKLKTLAELKKLVPETPNTIGHLYEGPITTAVLIMGQEFFILVYDNPEKAHKLLKFCVKSALNYAKAILNHFGKEMEEGPKGIPDDFAGILPPKLFPEFVLPYWNEIYEGLKATERSLHSELLREEHLKFLKDVKIEVFDPSTDQYLNEEILSKSCPCKFTLRIKSWEIFNLNEDELEKLYIKLASYKPLSINFSLDRLIDLPKIKRLLRIAREYEKDI